MVPVGCLPHPQADPCPVHAGIHTLPAQCMLGYGQQAGGTHPIGMLSCLEQVLFDFGRYSTFLTNPFVFLFSF